MTRIIAIAAAALVLIGGAVWWQTSQTANSTSFERLGMAEAQSAEAGAEVDTSLVTEMTLGDAEAPVTVIEYASFTCPHCKSFHKDVFPQLKADYIDTGKVHFIYREVYFDRFGLWAGMVASCGGEEKYFGIAEMIYDQQAEWTKGESPADIAENLSKIGRTAGLSGDEIDACLRDEAMALAMIQVFEDTSKADEVNSTPTFIIDGEKYSNMNYADFAETLDGKLPE